jgi:hypothetical protein
MEGTHVASARIIAQPAGFVQLSPRNDGHNEHRIAVLQGSFYALSIAHVLVVHIDVDSRTDLASLVAQKKDEGRKALLKSVQGLLDG